AAAGRRASRSAHVRGDRSECCCEEGLGLPTSWPKVAFLRRGTNRFSAKSACFHADQSGKSGLRGSGAGRIVLRPIRVIRSFRFDPRETNSLSLESKSAFRASPLHRITHQRFE